MLRSIIELTLAINCLLLSRSLFKLSDRVRRLEHEVTYLSIVNDLKGDEKKWDQMKSEKRFSN